MLLMSVNLNSRIYLLRKMTTTFITCLVISTTMKKNINKPLLMNWKFWITTKKKTYFGCQKLRVG